MISANRAGNTAELNNKVCYELRRDVKNAGFGYVHVAHVEGEVLSQPSLLVIGCEGKDDNRLKYFLVKNGEKYDQEGVLYKDQGELNAKFIYTSKGRAGTEEDLGKFHANGSAAQYFANLNCNRGPRCQEKLNASLTVLYLEPKGFFVRREMLYM
jgi:hypothetical protein